MNVLTFMFASLCAEGRTTPREISEKGAIPFDEYDIKVESKVIEINYPEERAPNPAGRVVPSFDPF